MTRKIIKVVTMLFLVAISLGVSVAIASKSGGAKNAGEVAAEITGTLANVAKLITAISYVAGLGFAIGAILKFKAHKDNPTQIPVGTPIALVFIAAALLFMPALFSTAGATLFGDTAYVAGASGISNFGTKYTQ